MGGNKQQDRLICFSYLLSYLVPCLVLFFQVEKRSESMCERSEKREGRALLGRPSKFSVFIFLSMHAACRHAVFFEVTRAIWKHFVVCIFLIVCRTKSENERTLEETIAIDCDYD